MTYKEFICDVLRTIPLGMPVYTSRIAEQLAAAFGIDNKSAAAATAVAIKRILDEQQLPNLRFYQKGIYYLCGSTPFGETGINVERLIEDKYLLPDIGYETGAGVLHYLGLTTQMPKERILATNKAAGGVRRDERLGVLIRPPRVTVNKKNKLYLQLLDVLENLDKTPVDAEEPYALIADYIKSQGLEYSGLLAIADRSYGKKTILQLAHTAGVGGLNI